MYFFGGSSRSFEDASSMLLVQDFGLAFKVSIVPTRIPKVPFFSLGKRKPWAILSQKSSYSFNIHSPTFWANFGVSRELYNSLLWTRTHLGGGFKHFLFSPLPGADSILTNIFQMGWNHQPVMIRPWNLGAKLSGYQVVVAHEKVLASGGTTWVELMGLPKKTAGKFTKRKGTRIFCLG